MGPGSYSSRRSRALAAYALGRSARKDERAKEAVAALQAAIRDPEEVCTQVVTSLGEMGDEAIPFLVGVLDELSPAVDEQIRDVLLLEFGARARPALEEAKLRGSAGAAAILRSLTARELWEPNGPFERRLLAAFTLFVLAVLVCALSRLR